MIELLPTDLHLLKVAIASIGAFIICSLTSCGFSSPGGYVIGTTSYLSEYNNGGAMHREPSRRDKKALDNMIRSSYK